MRASFVTMVLLCPALFGSVLSGAEDASGSPPLRIGYFLGGRTSILMRAQTAGDFDRNGVFVRLMARRLRDNRFLDLASRNLNGSRPNGTSRSGEGKATGLELVAGVLDGRWDLASIGESSFLAAAADGQPIVAIAELGHDMKNNSGHLFALRKGVSISKPADYLGKVFVSRRAGPGDYAFLLEFLSRQGVDTDHDVSVLDHIPATPQERETLPRGKVFVAYNVFEDEIASALAQGTIDGGYFHLMAYENTSEYLQSVKPLHSWEDPALSMAVLVCSRDFLKSEGNRKRLKAFLRVYISRIHYEKSLSRKDRTAAVNTVWLTMESQTPGFNYPQYDDVPLVDAPRLYRMIDLLKKHQLVSWPKMDLEPYIDNSLVKEVAAETPLPQVSANH